MHSLLLPLEELNFLNMICSNRLTLILSHFRVFLYFLMHVIPKVTLCPVFSYCFIAEEKRGTFEARRQNKNGCCLWSLRWSEDALRVSLESLQRINNRSKVSKDCKGEKRSRQEDQKSENKMWKTCFTPCVWLCIRLSSSSFSLRKLMTKTTMLSTFSKLCFTLEKISKDHIRSVHHILPKRRSRHKTLVLAEDFILLAKG
jgi:hypothetical protein